MGGRLTLLLLWQLASRAYLLALPTPAPFPCSLPQGLGLASSGCCCLPRVSGRAVLGGACRWLLDGHCWRHDCQLPSASWIEFCRVFRLPILRPSLHTTYIGLDNIRDVIPFPRWPGNATY